MKRLKSKISRAMVFYIVIFSSVVTLVLTAMQLRLEFNYGIQSLHQQIYQIEATNLDSINRSLWTMNHSALQTQLDGLKRLNDIVYIKIVDTNNKLIAAAGEINTDNTITKNFILQHDYRDKKNQLGTLVVVATKENVYQHLIDTVIVILISQAIKTFIVSLFILFLFYYLVTRHLEKISQHSEKHNLYTAPQLLTLGRKNKSPTHYDELDLVVNSINTMSNDSYISYNNLIKNQQALSDREAKFSAMFNSMPDAIIFADNDRKIIQTNPAFHSLFGYELRELKNETTLKLYAHPEEYIDQGENRYNDQSQTSTAAYEIDYRRKDGSTFPSETMGGPVISPDGTQIGLIGIIRDVTEKKRLQTELQQSQKMDAIGQLTGGIAHDFNNVLASILGYSDLTMSLLKDTDNPKLIKYIKNINKAGEHARDLVMQLLAFSRSAPGQTEVLDLSNLIQDVTSLLRPTIPSNIKLDTIIDDHVPAVLMDNTQMHQMLMNLCINARDAIEDHGNLSISLSHDTNVNTICSSCKQTIEGEYVKLSVEDTGTGMQKDLLNKIFDPFLTTKDVGKGTGMGLSVVHGILHKHQSHIVVETEAGSGSHFHLLIPPISEDMKTTEINQAEVITATMTDKGMHILIVDDEEGLALFLQDFLQSHDFKVTATISSQEAVDLVRQPGSQFDLIITDQTMPEMSGIEMAQQIWKINADIPVILCSGYNKDIGEIEALEIGCSKYLAKPVNNNLLLQSIHEALISKRPSNI